MLSISLPCARRLGRRGWPGLVLLAGLWTSACSPQLNWREVRAPSAPLSLLLPCKPDQGARTVPFAGRETAMQMIGCEAAGMTFAVAHAEIAAESDAPSVLRQWSQLSLSHVRALGAQEQPATVAGASVAWRVRATGQRPDGAAVQTEALYFAQGRRVYQAVLYAGAGARDAREAAETFLSSLKLQ